MLTVHSALGGERERERDRERETERERERERQQWSVRIDFMPPP